MGVGGGGKCAPTVYFFLVPNKQGTPVKNSPKYCHLMAFIKFLWVVKTTHISTVNVNVNVIGLCISYYHVREDS